MISKGEKNLKKLIVIITLIAILFTGCSSEKKTVNDDVTEKTSPSNNKQTKPQSSLLDNIDTTKSPFEKGYYDYEGSISNNMPIQMSIYPLVEDIVGSYFHESKKKEIKLKGKAGEKDIVLYEYDKEGKNTGIFKGTRDADDKIEGTWISADNKTSYPFTLSLKSYLPGVEYGKRYAVAVGTESDQDVENFVNKIQSYVVNDNKKKLAEQVRYPISVKINDKITKIQNVDEFIKNYNEIFNAKYKQVISDAFIKYMFVNWQGIMFGPGLYNMWISETTNADGNAKLMIVAINN